jgi:hypothetical protein
MNIGHGCAFYRPTDDRLFLSSCRPTAAQFESAHRDFLGNSPAQSEPAYRKNWAENLYKKHLKQGRLEKYKDSEPENQSDNEGNTCKNKITNKIIPLDENGKYRDSTNKSIENNATRKESIKPGTDRHVINKRKIENVNTIRHEELLEDLEQSFLEDQTKIVREPLTPTIKLEFKNCIVEALIDTGAEISAITKELYDELSQSNEILDILPIKKFILRGVFSEKGDIIANKAKIAFKYENENFEHEYFILYSTKNDV